MPRTIAKYRLNWLLIGILLGGVVVTGAVVHVAHGFQLERHANDIRAEVTRAVAEDKPNDAIDALERYLAINPTHQESLAKLGKLLDHYADTPVGWSRALTVNEKVLAREPSNHEQRRRVISLARKLGDLQLAANNLAFLESTLPEDGGVVAQLGDALLAGNNQDHAIPKFEKSIILQPKQTLAYVRLANIKLRLKDPGGAAAVIDQMVKAQPDRPQVYLERGYFLQAEGKLDDAALDFAKARQLGAAEWAPLLAAAELAMARGQYDEAARNLEEGKKQRPNLLAWYRDGGELCLLQGKPDDALAWVEEGQKLNPQDINLWHLRIEASRMKKDFTAAEEDLAKLRRLPNLPRGLAAFLEARLLLQRGEIQKAVGRLQSLEADRNLSVALRARAALSLAEAAGVLGQHDRQLAELRHAINLDATLRQAALLLGRMYLARGRTEEARELLFKLTRDSEPQPEAFVEYARALMLTNLGLSVEDRNWTAPLAALQRVEKLEAQKSDAALIRADILLAQNKPAEAEEVLAKVSAEKPKDVRVWAARVALARRLGDPSRARRLESEAAGVVEDSTLLRLGTLQNGDSVTAGEIRTAERELEAKLPKLPRGQQIAVLIALGRNGPPERYATQLADLNPPDGASLVPALELAVIGRDSALVERIVTELRRIEGESSASAKFGEAAWLVRTGRRQRPELLDKARPILRDVMKDRPDWSAPAAWLGRLEDQADNPTEAAKAYQKAFELGERNTVLTLRLLELLVDERDYDAADRVYRQLERTLIPGGQLARLGAEIAFRRKDVGRAKELAERAQPASGATAAYLLWQASFLNKLGDTRDALKIVMRAVDLDPVNPDGWVLWVDLLMKSNNRQAADQVMVQVTERQAVDLQAVTLAQCEALLGRHARAIVEFERALKHDKEDVYALMQAATYFLSQKNMTRARPLLEQLRRLGPRLPEDKLRWVEQQLQ